MIFAKLNCEDIVQTLDQTRIDASKCFSDSISIISKIEICPDFAVVAPLTPVYYDVTTLKYLDWSYSTENKTTGYTVKLRLTDSATPTPNVVYDTKYIKAYSSTTDLLVSSDNDLITYEADVLRYVRPGRNSFLDIHREARDEIMRVLNQKGIKDSDGDKLTIASLLDKEEIKNWSRFFVLKVIFESFSNQIDDVFDRKSKKYFSLMMQYQTTSLANLTLDTDLDDEEDTIVHLSSIELRRR
jgi:hypothetical protein